MRLGQSPPSRRHRAASWLGSGLSRAITPVSSSTALISAGSGRSLGALGSRVARMRSASSMSRRSAGGAAVVIGAAGAISTLEVNGRSMSLAPSPTRSSRWTVDKGTGSKRATPRQTVPPPGPPLSNRMA